MPRSCLAGAMKVIDIARIAHEVNRAFCQSTGDYSQPDWSNAPQWQVDSAIDGVQYLIENPQANAGDSHRAWMRHKYLEGWIYGPVKDPAMKHHPALVPYDELPPEQKVKDALFHAVVRGLA